MAEPVELLIVGAGPVGLALALQARAHGANVRIIERRKEPFRPSRALIMHPRTLEVLRPLGVTDAILAHADTDLAVNLHLGKRVVAARLGTLPMPDTPFPHLTLVRQMDVERVLSQALTERGVTVERGATVSDLQQDCQVVQIRLETQAGTEIAGANVVVGCDGPESIVRRSAGINWQGGRYGQEIALADLELNAELEPGVTHAVAGRRGLVLLFSLGELAPWRLLATRPTGTDQIPFGQPGPPIPVEELQLLLDEAGFGVRIARVAWSARYRLQHRLAAQFRAGRLFIAGDAAHTYSPATGQGMNTGIQDALNLGWKLAFAPNASDPETLLNSYEVERRPVVRRALAMTHLAFWAEASPHGIPAFLRGQIAPLAAPLMPFLLGRKRLIAEGERIMSQLNVSYRNSPLSDDGNALGSRHTRPGHRLPDATVTVDGRETRLHALIARPGIQLLLQSGAAPITPTNGSRLVAVHQLSSIPGTGLIAVRPDGYVGYRDEATSLNRLNAWLSRIGSDQVSR